MSGESDRDKQLQSTTSTTAMTAASDHTPDGYDEEEPGGRRAIIGSFVKFVEGEWTMGGVPIDPDYRPIVIDLDHGLQHWKDNQLVEERFEKPLDDVDELNSRIPQEEWDLFPNGEQKPPWSPAFKFYLLDDKTGTRATFVTNTIGGGIAFGELKDKVKWMRKMRGPNILPRVQLSTAPMRTRYSPYPKKRPDLKVVEYVMFTSGGFTPLPPASAPPAGNTPPQVTASRAQPMQTTSRLHRVEEPTLRQEMNDDLQF
jgi:hypothetical protein